MKKSITRFPALLGVATLCAIAFAGPAYAQMTQPDEGHSNYFEQDDGYSDDYSLQGGSTWLEDPLASDDFILEEEPSSEPAASGSQAQPAVTGGGGRGKTTAPAALVAPRRTAVPASKASASSASSKRVSSAPAKRSSKAASVRSAAPRSSAPSNFVPFESLRLKRLDLRQESAASQPCLHGAALPNSSLFKAELVSMSGQHGAGLLWFILGAFSGFSALGGSMHWKRIRAFGWRKLFHLALLLAVLPAFWLHVPRAEAAQTVPALRVYNGRLLRSSGTPVTSAHSIRFSYWNTSDYQTTDLTSTGAINTGSPGYMLWQETHTVTPDANGNFSVIMGAQVPLPDYADMPQGALLSLFLQVEVKRSTLADTSFQLLDSNPSSATIDRNQLLSVPMARNADLLDQHDTGTGSSDIPVLGSDGKLPDSVLPGTLNREDFTLDADDSATGDISLRFGQTLSKTLSFDTVQDRFSFNDDVYIQGNLTVSGLVNGIDLAALGGGGSGAQLLLREFHPSYPNASYAADGSSNVGQLSVATETGTLRSYYQWTTTRSSLQDYDIVVRFTLPQTFLRWQDSPLSLAYRSSTGDASSNKADIAVFDTAGDEVTLSGSVLDLASASWASTNADFTGSPTWNAGQDMVVRIKVSAKDLSQMLIGGLQLRFVTLSSN